MNIADVTIWLAFAAGFLSFLSPCVFSLVPAYVGYLSGRAAGGEGGENNKLTTFLHGVAFVLGFSVVFVVFGVAASALGGLVFGSRVWLSRIGGIIVIIFGLHMIGVYRIPFLEYDTRVQTLPDPKWGYLSSALMGVFFSAGWSPCVGPVYGAILTALAARGSSILEGAVYLSAYSAGLGIPFLLAALSIGWVSVTLRKYGKAMHYVEITMGVILVIVGFLLFSGALNTLSRYGTFVDFGL